MDNMLLSFTGNWPPFVFCIYGNNYVFCSISCIFPSLYMFQEKIVLLLNKSQMFSYTPYYLDKDSCNFMLAKKARKIYFLDWDYEKIIYCRIHSDFCDYLHFFCRENTVLFIHLLRKHKQSIIRRYWVNVPKLLLVGFLFQTYL